MGNFIYVLFIGILTLALYAGFSAGMAYLMMILWNFIAINTSHPTAQISFYVAWAGWFLLSLVGGFFQSSTSSK